MFGKINNEIIPLTVLKIISSSVFSVYMDHLIISNMSLIMLFSLDENVSRPTSLTYIR